MEALERFRNRTTFRCAREEGCPSPAECASWRSRPGACTCCRTGGRRPGREEREPGPSTWAGQDYHKWLLMTSCAGVSQSEGEGRGMG